MRRLAVLAVLCLAACAPKAPETATDAQVMVRPVSYVCADGRSMITAFRQDENTTTVIAGGLTKVLPGVPAASGAKFAQGGFEFWSHGSDATLTGFPGGPYADCKEG
ncbi:MAG: MliC family protein [Caulobacteraceae bacterium]